MLILLYCTAVPKLRNQLCVLKVYTPSWVILILGMLQVLFIIFESKLAGFLFFFLFWSTWKPGIAILTSNHSEDLHVTSCDFCCTDQHYSLLYTLSLFILHWIVLCNVQIYTLGQRFCHQHIRCSAWLLFLKKLHFFFFNQLQKSWCRKRKQNLHCSD